MTREGLSKEDLAAAARAVGLDLGDERLEELLPEMRRAAKAFQALEALDLEAHEPAVTFRPGKH